MMLDCTCKMTWGAMQPISELQRLVMMRSDICRESAEASVKATAITILKSLRAETKKAGKRPKVIEGRYRVMIEDTPYVAGWAKPGKSSPMGRRVARSGSGAMDKIGGKNIINLAGNWRKREQVYVYHVRIFNTAAVGTTPFADCHCFAHNQKEVEKWTEMRIRKRIGQYRGVSKRAIGLAMHLVAGTPTEVDSAESEVKRLVERVVNVRTRGGGGSDGAYSITVNDDLPMAALALKNGPNSVNLALMRAANATAKKIQKKLGVEFGAVVETPFPEVKTTRRAMIA